MNELAWLLPILLMIVAFLYASVGHGGASGYLAVLALVGGVSNADMKSSALILNLLVSLVAFWQFRQHFQWELFWAFALLSVPAAYFGAQIPITDGVYKKLLAVFLAFPILRLMISLAPKKQTGPVATNVPPIGIALAIGAVIGLLSGMLGIGGGILLSPLILLLGWADMKPTAAVSALFIFVNSLSGLAGLLAKGFEPPSFVYVWLGFAFVGGLAGAYMGSQKLNTVALRYTLALVLSIAALKLFFT